MQPGHALSTCQAKHIYGKSTARAVRVVPPLDPYTSGSCRTGARLLWGMHSSGAPVPVDHDSKQWLRPRY